MEGGGARIINPGQLISESTTSAEESIVIIIIIKLFVSAKFDLDIQYIMHEIKTNSSRMQ